MYDKSDALYLFEEFATIVIIKSQFEAKRFFSDVKHKEHGKSTDLILRGTNLSSTVKERFTRSQLSLVKLPSYFNKKHTKYYSTNGVTPIVPVKSYDNAESKKVFILKDNIRKAGIYRWVNKENGKTYIGSAVNLSRRLAQYYSLPVLFNNNMLIYKALLKYGYSYFILEILEYCEPENVVSREQYYLYLYKPEYNILKTAGSLLGFNHS